jgi:hypothetical protein
MPNGITAIQLAFIKCRISKSELARWLSRSSGLTMNRPVGRRRLETGSDVKRKAQRIVEIKC